MSRKATHVDVDVMVIFGVSGDLAHKMTYPSLYHLEERRLLDFPIVGVAIDDWDDERLREELRTSIRAGVSNVSHAVLERLAARCSYVRGDFSAPATFETLRRVIGARRHALVYLETPPSFFAAIIEGAQAARLANEVTYLVEKPFGHDLASARELNDRLHAVVAEQQLLRVDHFLGKLPLEDLVQLRFANELLEPLWRREHVARIEITMAESFGVEDRGSFYDPVGALRDVVQNHLLQLLALVLMEPPTRAGADGLWDARVEVLRAVPSVDPRAVVRGQYAGYRSIQGVRPDSTTETFVALPLEAHTWRWSGVPIAIRAGKALAATVTEVRLVLRHPPRIAGVALPQDLAPNEIVLRVDPAAGMRIVLNSRAASNERLRRVHLDLDFAAELGRPRSPYEVLFAAALQGDRSLFAREDVVEETWRIVDPLLADPPAPEVYQPGSWGPESARRVLPQHAAWREPWLVETA